MKIYLVSAIKGAYRISTKFYSDTYADVEKQFLDINPAWVITEIRLVGFIHEGVTYNF